MCPGIPPPIHHEVQIETVLLSVHSGTVLLKPVPEEDDETLRGAMTEDIDADAVTPVPREASPIGKG